MEPSNLLRLFYRALLRPALWVQRSFGANPIDLRFRGPSTWRPNPLSAISGSFLKQIPVLRYRPHPYWLYDNDPRFRAAGGKHRHNRLGCRGPEVSTRPKKGVYRILCTGESSTYCTGIVDDSQTYPARLEYHLRQRSGLPPVEVLNAGVGATNSAENLMRFIFRFRDFGPHLLLYYFTHNDVHPRRLPFVSRDYHEWNQVWSSYEEDCRASQELTIDDAIRRKFATRKARKDSNILINPPDTLRDNFISLAALATAYQVRLAFVLPTYPQLQETLAASAPIHGQYTAWAVRQHREAVMEAAARFDCPVFDLHGRIPSPADRQPSDCYMDSVHFNEKGADLAGSLLAESLAPLISIYP